MNKLIKEALEREIRTLEKNDASTKINKLKERIKGLELELATAEGAEKSNSERIQTIKDYIK